MRTVFVVVNSSWNVINFRLGLVESLVARGDHVFVLAPDDGFEDDIRKSGCTFCHLPMKAHSINVLRETLTFLSCLYYILRFKPDLCLTFTIKPNMYFGFLCNLLRSFCFVPNVAGLGSGFKNDGIFATFLSLLLKFSFLRAKIVFFQNSNDSQKLCELNVVKASKARLLPGSGVNVQKLVHSLPGNSHPGNLHFVLAGRLLESKGIFLFCEAAAIITKEYPNAIFSIAGFANLSNSDAISLDVIRQLENDFPVSYVGEYKDVTSLMSGFDCVVLPSFYPEGTPRVLLEGLALGKIIVTTDMPGCRDTVVEGVNGFLCSPRSTSSLSDALRKVLQLSQSQIYEFSSESRSLALSTFDEKIVIDNYLSLNNC